MCFEELANLAETARSDATITQALDRVAHAGCADTAECVANLRFVATHEVLRGNHRMALAALQRARAMTPEDDALLAEVAALASKVDLHAEALRSYETLAQRHPDDPRWPAAIAAERLLLVEGSIPVLTGDVSSEREAVGGPTVRRRAPPPGPPGPRCSPRGGSSIGTSSCTRGCSG